MIRYCLPIIAASKDETRSIIASEAKNYSFFEVWLDYLEDLDRKDEAAAFVSELSQKLKGQLIVLFRRKNLETIRMPLEWRKEILNILSKDESMIDIDIRTQEAELKYVKGLKSVRTILSYHNYERTPEAAELQKILKEMEKLNPHISKISTLCQTPDDALRLLQLLREVQEGSDRKVIILGMGEHGAPTRIFGTLWGNEFVFAPADSKHESAPGQLTRAELSKIFDVISAS